MTKNAYQFSHYCIPEDVKGEYYDARTDPTLYHVRAGLQVVGRQSAFARIDPATGLGGTSTQGLYRKVGR